MTERKETAGEEKVKDNWNMRVVASRTFVLLVGSHLIESLPSCGSTVDLTDVWLASLASLYGSLRVDMNTHTHWHKHKHIHTQTLLSPLVVVNGLGVLVSCT